MRRSVSVSKWTYDFLFLFGFMVLVACDSLFYRDYVVGFFSVILFIAYYLTVSNRDPQFYWLSFYFLFALFVSVICSLIIEHGAYLWEIDQVGVLSGLSVRAALYSFVTISGAYYAYLLVGKVRVRFYTFAPSQESFVRLGVRALTLGLGFALLYISFSYGTPNSLGVHRADYWVYHAPSWGGMINYWLVQMAFPLGFMYSQKLSKVDLCLFFYVVFLVILMGERFTGIFLAFFFFTLPYLFFNKMPLLKIMKKPKAVLSVLVLLMLITWTLLQSYFVTGKGWVEAVAMVMGRAVVQAEMWWALDQISSLEARSLEEVLVGFLGMGVGNTESGVYYLMHLVAPADVVDYRIETGSSFTMSGVFNNVYFFGFLLGGIANFVYGGIFGFCCGLLRSAFCSSNVLAAVFSFKLMYKVMVVLLSGKIPQLFSFGTFALFVAAVLFVDFRKRMA